MTAAGAPAMSSLSLVRAGAPLGRLLRRIGRLAAAALQRQAERRAYRRLLGLSEHQLRDIGLTRGEVLRALCQAPGSEAARRRRTQ